MGAHPGHVMELIENPVPRPRDRDQFLSRPYLSLKRRLGELIQADAGAESLENLPLARLANAEDQVE